MKKNYYLNRSNGQYRAVRMLFLVMAFVVTQLMLNISIYGQDDRGAKIPFVRHEAEEAISEGAIIKGAALMNADIESQIASEATDRKYVSLSANGSSLKWKVKNAGNFVRVRYSIPNSAVEQTSLDVFVNGSKVKTVDISSHWMGPNRRFDEVHFKLAKSLKAGDELRIQSADNTPVGIDYITLEASSLMAAPAGFTDVTAYGAVANDGGDDLAAFNAAYAAATVGVYIPAGTFNLSSIWQINKNNVKIQGAGIASTTLFFTQGGTMHSGILAVVSGVEISNFYMNTVNTTRDGSPGKGIMGTYGTGSNIHDLEIHHFECGAWIGGYSTPLQVTQNMIFQNNRIIDNWADGINLCQGTSNCTITNNYFSGNWDDGIALWPNNEYGAPMEVNNIISYNTVENNKRAGGIAIFGGNGHQVFNNIVRNSTACSGIRFTTDFPGYHFENTTQIRIYNNTLTNVGCNVDYWGCSRGAIEIDAVNQPIQGLLFDNNTIINSQRHAVQMGSNQSVTNIVFNNLTVNGVGTSGATNSCFTVAIPSCVIMTYGNNGNVTFNNLCISNVPSNQYVYQSNPTGFKLNVTYGCGTSVPVTGVTVSPTSASIGVGATQQLTATVSPSNASNKGVSWSSSNNGVASVNGSGLITGVAAGTATITVTTSDGGKTATSSITVTSVNVPVTGVTLNQSTMALNVGQTGQLTATVSPTNASNKSVTWSSSNTAIASVSTSGLVTAVANGSATITVRTNDQGKTATCAVTVTTASQTPKNGTPWVLPGTIEAEDYDNGGENVAYHDSNTGNTGNQYRADGVDIEACSEGGYNVGWIVAAEWLEYTVNVPTTGTYNVDARVSSGAATGSFRIEFGGVDKTGTITIPNTGGWQTWQSVTKTGLSLTAGTQVMRVYMVGSDFNINKMVFTGGGTVVPVTGVTVSPTSASIGVNGTQQLTATVSPSNASNKSVTWSSSNTAVATVNSSGLVTGVAAGTATITVRTNDQGKTATCAITVTTTTVPVTGVTLSPTSASITVGTTRQLTATVSPTNATNKSVTWTSSNTAIATVNSSGLVTGVAAGSATITVRTNDQGKTATSAITVTGTTTTAYRIKNRWQNTYLYDAGDRVRYNTTASGTTYNWIFEDVGGGVQEIKNVGTGEYMHIENLYGYVQCTARTSGWMSSRWTREDAGSGFIRFKNVWQPSYYMHVENLQSQLQYGTIYPEWQSAMWSLETVAGSSSAIGSNASFESSIYPNPVLNGQAKLTISNVSENGARILVVDLQGKLLYDAITFDASNNLDLNHLNKGIYFIKVQNNNDQQVLKLMIQ